MVQVLIFTVKDKTRSTGILGYWDTVQHDMSYNGDTVFYFCMPFPCSFKCYLLSIGLPTKSSHKELKPTKFNMSKTGTTLLYSPCITLSLILCTSP